MSTYCYTDPYGYHLQICPSGVARGDVKIEANVAVDVPAADLPKIVAEMYTAAGQEPPILLPRRSPEMSWVADGGYVSTLLTPGDLMTPLDIRDLCSWYASAADLADAVAEQKRQEAEQGQVEELVDVITGLDPLLTPKLLARAILAAGYTRSES